MGVRQLGYLVLDVSDINAWRDLAASIMGAEERRDEGADLVRLRFDEHHHRITLRRAKTDSVAAQPPARKRGLRVPSAPFASAAAEARR